MTKYLFLPIILLFTVPVVHAQDDDERKCPSDTKQSYRCKVADSTPADDLTEILICRETKGTDPDEGDDEVGDEVTFFEESGPDAALLYEPQKNGRCPNLLLWAYRR